MTFLERWALFFHTQVEDLLAVEEQISVDARSLETCPYSAQSLADILSRLQRAIDDLSLRQYSNLHLWVQRLDEEVILFINHFFLSHFCGWYCCVSLYLKWVNYIVYLEKNHR